MIRVRLRTAPENKGRIINGQNCDEIGRRYTYDGKASYEPNFYLAGLLLSR